MSVTHGHINRCMGKWVICHTRRNSFTGMLLACGGDHLVLYAPTMRGTPISMEVNEVNREQLPEEDISLIWFGNVIVPLAAVVGLTVIGATAAAGFW